MPISTRALVNFCHRVGTAVRTGIDARRLWEMEERHATGATRGAISTIRQHVNSGGTIAEGMLHGGEALEELRERLEFIEARDDDGNRFACAGLTGGCIRGCLGHVVRLMYELRQADAHVAGSMRNGFRTDFRAVVDTIAPATSAATTTSGCPALRPDVAARGDRLRGRRQRPLRVQAPELP